MKDIPLFTTEYGIASLTLKEIPYTGKAYIRIQDSLQPEKLLDECRDFCRAVGAEEIYAAGHTCLERLERHCRILKLRCAIDNIGDTDAALFPVSEKTLNEFRNIYNKAMMRVPNASYMTIKDSEELLKNGGGYFIHKDHDLLGIGIAKGERLDVIVSLVPGMGKCVLQTLCHALCSTMVELEVAEENMPAMKLYEKMGFIPVSEVAVWYKII